MGDSDARQPRAGFERRLEAELVKVVTARAAVRPDPAIAAWSSGWPGGCCGRRDWPGP
jgi:hypothetical protein